MYSDTVDLVSKVQCVYILWDFFSFELYVTLLKYTQYNSYLKTASITITLKLKEASPPER